MESHPITILAGNTAKIPFHRISGIDQIPADPGRNTRRTIKNLSLVLFHSDLSQWSQTFQSFHFHTRALPSWPKKRREDCLDFIPQIFELIYIPAKPSTAQLQCTRAVHQLSDNMCAHAWELAATGLFSIVYDNININFRNAKQVIGHHSTISFNLAVIYHMAFKITEI